MGDIKGSMARTGPRETSCGTSPGDGKNETDSSGHLCRAGKRRSCLRPELGPHGLNPRPHSVTNLPVMTFALFGPWLSCWW